MQPFSYSGFHIKRALIPISLQGQAGDPRRCPPHFLTDFFYRSAQRTFDDHLIVDMSDDPVVPQSVHSITENVTADSLCTVPYYTESLPIPDGEPVPRTTIPDVVDTFLASGFLNNDSVGQASGSSNGSFPASIPHCCRFCLNLAPFARSAPCPARNSKNFPASDRRLLYPCLRSCGKHGDLDLCIFASSSARRPMPDDGSFRGSCLLPLSVFQSCIRKIL